MNEKNKNLNQFSFVNEQLKSSVRKEGKQRRKAVNLNISIRSD